MRKILLQCVIAGLLVSLGFTHSVAQAQTSSKKVSKKKVKKKTAHRHYKHANDREEEGEYLTGTDGTLLNDGRNGPLPVDTNVKPGTTRCAAVSDGYNYAGRCVSH